VGYLLLPDPNVRFGSARNQAIALANNAIEVDQ
jgi:hypothetical protein